MSMASPDPVTAPSEYQRLMLSLVGEDDPASVQEETPGAVRAMIATAAADLRRRPAESEWSVLELVGHLADAELVMAARYRWVLAHEEPPIAAYDQDRWVDRLRHNEDDPRDLLALFEPLRRANLALWRRTPGPARQRVRSLPCSSPPSARHAPIPICFARTGRSGLSPVAGPAAAPRPGGRRGR